MICSKHEIETALRCACISLFGFILHVLLPHSTSRHLDQNQVKSARPVFFHLHGCMAIYTVHQGHVLSLWLTWLCHHPYLKPKLYSKIILRYLTQVSEASSGKHRSIMCSIAVVQVSVQCLHLRTWHLLSSAHDGLNRKARHRHLWQRPELWAARLLSPLQSEIVNHLHRITYWKKVRPLGLAWIMLAWTKVACQRSKSRTTLHRGWAGPGSSFESFFHENRPCPHFRLQGLQKWWMTHSTCCHRWEPNHFGLKEFLSDTYPCPPCISGYKSNVHVNVVLVNEC